MSSIKTRSIADIHIVPSKKPNLVMKEKSKGQKYRKQNYKDFELQYRGVISQSMLEMRKPDTS